MLRGNAFAHEQLSTDGVTAVSLTSSIYSPTGEISAVSAFVTTDPSPNAPLRYRLDGGTPTNINGHFFGGTRPGLGLTLRSLAAIQNFMFIADSTVATAIINITYFR